MLNLKRLKTEKAPGRAVCVCVCLRFKTLKNVRRVEKL